MRRWVLALLVSTPAHAQMPSEMVGEWHRGGQCEVGAISVQPGSFRLEGRTCDVEDVQPDGQALRVTSSCGVDLFQTLDRGRFLVMLHPNKAEFAGWARCDKAGQAAAAANGLTCSLGRGSELLASAPCDATKQVSGRGTTVGYRWRDGTTVSVFADNRGRVVWNGRPATRDAERGAGCVRTGEDWFCAR